jgi:hypothetical protein
VKILYGINTGNPWFSTDSFAKAPTNVQGNSGYDIISGPGLVSLNASLSRWIEIPSHRDTPIKMQLRLDSLNVTNTPQFSNPNTSNCNGSATTNCTGGAFGFVTSTLSSGTGVNGTGGGRVVTLALKIYF